jgi:hypothetical protein
MDRRFDEILQKLNTIDKVDKDMVIITGAVLTGSFNEIRYTSGSKKS